MRVRDNLKWASYGVMERDGWPSSFQSDFFPIGTIYLIDEVSRWVKFKINWR